MDVQDLRKLLEESKDKFSIFEDKSTLSKYDFNMKELLDLISDFLTDEQKARLFKLEHFKKMDKYKKTRIMKCIYDSKIKLTLLEDYDFISEFDNYEVKTFVKDLDDNVKIEILHQPGVLKKYEIGTYEIQDLIKSLSDENIQKLLYDKDFIEKELKLEKYNISNIMSKLEVGAETDKVKSELIDFYKLEKYQIVDVLKTFSDKSKKTILIENKYGFYKRELEDICSALSVDGLINFLKENKEFFVKNAISPYRITQRLDKQNQLDFISKFEDIGLSIGEKRQVLATLKQETKNDIDISNFSPEYVTAIKMQTSNEFKSYGKIIIDFSQDLEKYRDLDEIISLNPLQVSSEDNSKILQLCEICPRMSIYDNIGLSTSTVEEYTKAERWIESVLQEVNAEWSDIQKVAFIDNAIGKKISYTPDFDTEVCNAEEARALWKIICSGYGVCNGISQVEKYILSRIGIESEMVSSGRHSFLKLKNIEIPNEQGEITIGDTILDPTWNLAAHRYGAKPENFCRSYEKIREHDVRADGTDVECHKNDEILANSTLDLDEQNLRKIFTSIGIADKHGNFPIKDLIDKSKMIDNYKMPEEEKLNKQFQLLSKYCPEFATCQNSTLNILQGIILNQENFNFNKCVVNRVYERDDESKSPVLYVYVDLPQAGKKFYVADKQIGQFLELSQKEFESRFECYEMDKEKQGGYRPWEDVKTIENVEDLNKSSGKVIITEGEEK